MKKWHYLIVIIKPWLYLRYKSCRTTLSNAMDYSKKFQQCTIYVLFISKPACTVAHSKGLLFIIMYNHQNWLLFDCKRIIAKQLTAIYIRNDTKFPLFCSADMLSAQHPSPDHRDGRRKGNHRQNRCPYRESVGESLLVDCVQFICDVNWRRLLLHVPHNFILIHDQF